MLLVDCRIGSLERSDTAKRFTLHVDCRIGSLEKNVIVAANNAFNDLPATIRERFGNDPAVYFEFVQSLKKGSDDYAEAIRLGIVNEPTDGASEVPSRSAESSGEEVNS